MWGSPAHLQELRRIVSEVHAGSASGSPAPLLEVLVAETNSEDSTYDGIDWGGERVAEEIYEAVARIKGQGNEVVKFSITGYSLGGLVARYVVGVLHQRKFFENITPVNFNTFATPHIGLLRYPSFISSVLSTLGPKLLSRTGEQFYGVDRWSARGRPLLDVLADPDRIFYQALTLFPQITIYANAVNDTTVPYATAAIEFSDPFVEHETNGISIEFDPKYKPVIKSYELPTLPPPPEKLVPFSGKWFGSFKPSRPLLPPALQFRFPFNILMYMAFPLLLPVFLSLIVIRLSRAARSSRSRIRLLENHESYRQRLVHIFAEVEQEVEDAVVDFIEEINGEPDQTTSGASTPPPGSKSKSQPILSPAQRTRIISLNKLPNLKKERAFIHPVRNSHATIVCRDVKRFEAHRVGAGVIHHWADHFVL
ncbi:hypothetical protein JAAARDRAFT_123313 [Jaapia argillacea MUCL 33604]|uniref:DUF676 domain-containing protein n=1 Tax=Jaapia argillacea MUCL 33604 TaxID=933084 RepID=A0A067Q323_9AGAM|nr:hypothetical protein JAAARDRAFT_123313 [Jaapia argillacea MUCL 33604]